MTTNSKRRADLMLVLVTLFWGLTFPLIRISVRSLAPEQFVAARFAIALLLFLPILTRVSDLKAKLIRQGLAGGVLGFVCWISYQSQTLGLRTVSAGRGAFITGTSVVLVPIFAPLFGAERPKPREWITTLIALAGLYLLTDPGNSSDAHSVAGDLWILLCAVSVAIYILLLARLSPREKGGDPTVLAFLQIFSVGVVSAPMLLVAAPPWRVPFSVSNEAWIGLAFCGTFATIGTFLLQTRYQPDTTPQRAALIFTLEPVFASIFGYWILGETFSPRGFLGAGLILGAVLVMELWPRREG